MVVCAMVTPPRPGALAGSAAGHVRLDDPAAQVRLAHVLLEHGAADPLLPHNRGRRATGDDAVPDGPEIGVGGAPPNPADLVVLVKGVGVAALQIACS
jgi:hypothetical protein